MEGTGLLFKPLLAELPASVHSKVVPLPPSKRNYAEIYATVADEIRRFGPSVVFAESFSGPLAMRCAAEMEGIRGLVLCNTFLEAPRSPLLRVLPWRFIFSRNPP